MMISRLKKRVFHITHPVIGEIWCLHRVVPQRSFFPSNRELEITPDFLDMLISRHLSARYEFVAIDDIVDSNSWIPRKRINISFDDGFHDIYDFAFPVLKKYNVPFTIYLTTDFPEGKADIWWIQLEKLVSSIDEYDGILAKVLKSDLPLASVMHELTNSVVDLSNSQSLSLSWAEIKEMVDSGLCTIGSHTISHPGLTRIGLDGCRFELEESRRIINERLGLEAIHFSYPHSMQSDIVRKSVQDVGFVSATLGYGGNIRKGDDKYRLCRRFITQP